MHILLYHPSKEVIDLLLNPLESATKSKVHAYISAENAMAALKTETFEAMILDLSEPAISKILQSANELKSPKPILFVCHSDHTAPTATKVTGWEPQGAVKYSNLLAELILLLKEKFPLVEEGDDSKFCPIRTAMLTQMSPLELDIFIRLTPNHYVKIFSPGDVFTGDDLNRYGERKKVSHMYVRDEASKQLIQLANDKLKQLLQGKPLAPAEAQQVLEETVDFVHGLIHGIGITPEVEELAKNGVDLAIAAMGDFPELSSVLDKIKNDNSHYIAKHSTLLAHVSCSIAVGMDWYSEMTFRKLTMAAFLHDISLTDDELCKVKYAQDFETIHKDRFTADQIAEYKKHPTDSTRLVQQFREMPAEVDKIVLMHHEHPGGIGFPDGLAFSNIGPLPSLFIMAHDLVDFYLGNDGKFQIGKFLRENEKKYTSGNFKKIARCLADLMT